MKEEEEEKKKLKNDLKMGVLCSLKYFPLPI